METEEEKKAAAEKAAAEKKEADEKALDERISKTVNSALTAHLKRKPGLGAEDLEKLLDEREKKRADAAAEEERKRKEAIGAGGDKNAPEIAKLQKEQAELRKKLEEREAKLAEQDKKQKAAEDKAVITKTLEAAGVPAGVKARLALNHLQSEGLVKRNEEGELVFITKDGEQDLADGITEFLKTEEGKELLPPSNAAGSGARGRRDAGSGSGGKKDDRRAKAAEALTKLRQSAG